MSSWRDRAATWGMVACAFASLAGILPPASAGSPGAPRFGFGQPATAAQIAGWDIDVRPDGRGLPAGRGTVERGQQIYDAQCASCHGTFGESTDYLPLAGGVGTLAGDQPIRTTGSKLNHATTLWDYINRAMPFGAPKTLAADEVYALTAYVLHLNDILPADGALDRESILKVKMPNRDGFTTAHGFGSKTGTPDTRNVACMRDCAGEPRLASQLPEHALTDHGNLAEQTRPAGRRASGAPSTASASAKPAGDDRATLAKSAGCTACHGAKEKIVGPAFSDIRGRYAGETGASERLASRVKVGGAGQWGPVPMPPHPQLKDADAKAIVEWILTGAY